MKQIAQELAKKFKSQIVPILDGNMLVKDGLTRFFNFETDLTLQCRVYPENGIYNGIGMKWNKTEMEMEEFPVRFKIKPEYICDLTKKQIDTLYKMRPFCAKDEKRPVLEGILFDKQAFVACDAVNLIVIKHFHSEMPDMIVSQEFITLLKWLTDKFKNANVMLRADENYIQALTSEFSLVTRLIDGTYPQYRTVIPKEEYPIRVALSSKAIKQAIKDAKGVGIDVHTLTLNLEEKTAYLRNKDLDYEKTFAITVSPTATDFINALSMPLYNETYGDPDKNTYTINPKILRTDIIYLNEPNRAYFWQFDEK